MNEGVQLQMDIPPAVSERNQSEIGTRIGSVVVSEDGSRILHSRPQQHLAAGLVKTRANLAWAQELLFKAGEGDYSLSKDSLRELDRAVSAFLREYRLPERRVLPESQPTRSRGQSGQGGDGSSTRIAASRGKSKSSVRERTRAFKA